MIRSAYVYLPSIYYKSESYQEDFERFSAILKSLNINIEIIKAETERYDDTIFFSWDEDEVNKKLKRGAGRQRHLLDISVAEVKERLKTETAEEVAKSLGMSRATLFRRIKNAEENFYEDCF